MDITKYGSQLFIVLEQTTVHLRQLQNTLTRMGRNVADKSRKLQEALRPAGIYLWQLFRIRLFVVSGQVTMRLQRGQDTPTRLGRSVTDKPRSLQKALRSRENELRELLTSSLDAVVVTNANGSLVGANSKALDLFGVTRTNMRKFTIDVFLSHSQIQQFGGRRLPFARRETRRGKCEIRRLDGSLRVAEYSFVANFTPFRHLCRFHLRSAMT